MNLIEYIAGHANDSVKVDIVERWSSRIIAQGLHTAGRAGAESYLAQYGKGMKTPKAIGFARCAELKGFPLFATRLWEEAFFLEFGSRATLSSPSASVPKDGLPTVILPTSPALPVPVVKAAFRHYPQLLVAVDRATAFRWMRDPTIALQEKVDGHRVMAEAAAGQIVAGNKRSLVRALPLNVVEALLAFGRDFVVDGELVGTTYYIFDLLEIDGRDLSGMGFGARWHALETFWSMAPAALRSTANNPAVRLVDAMFSESGKIALLNRLETDGKEGFVLKKSSAPYVAGESHGTQWKHQFRAVTACIAGGRNGTANSMEVFVLRPDGSQRKMGSVTMTGHEFPAPGSIVEIENLYTHPGADGCFAQAVYKGIRDDAVAADCREDKLRIKAA